MRDPAGWRKVARCLNSPLASKERCSAGGRRSLVLAYEKKTALEKAVFTSCSGAVQSADQSAQLPAVAQSSAPSLNAPM